MGKKKIQKQPKNEVKQITQEKQVKQVQKKGKKSQSTQILTPEFFTRLETFQSYYKQVLELKSEANKSNINDQIKQVNLRVRKNLEFQSKKILKDQLVNLQAWIKGQQNKLSAQINTVQKCYSQNEKSLKSTGEFTDGEVKSQLKPIRQKIQEKQRILNHYGSLLSKSKDIYNWDQSQIVEQIKEQNNGDIDIDV